MPNCWSGDENIPIYIDQSIDGYHTHTHRLQLCLLEGQGEVVLAGLTVPHQVARLFAQPEQGLRVSAADGSVVPAGGKEGT